MAALTTEADPFGAALQSLPTATVDISGTILWVNSGLALLTRYSTTEVVRQSITTLSVGTPTHSFIDVIHKVVQSGVPWCGEWVCLDKAGTPIPAEQTVTPIKRANGQILHLTVEIKDLRNQGLRIRNERPNHGVSLTTKQSPAGEVSAANSTGSEIGWPAECSKLLMQSQRDFELFFNLIPDLACIVSKDGYFKRVNKAWETTLGYTQEEVLRTPMLELVHPADLADTLKEIARQGPSYRTKHFINRYRHKNGTYRLFDWTSTFTRDDATRFGVARDITEQRLAERRAHEMTLQIAHSAEHDFLTGLPNRMLLNDRVSRAISMGERHNRKVALMFMDLDGFKHINDSLGHPTGDKLLQSIAKRLVSCVRDSDTVSRLGGDEFVVLLSEVGQSEDMSATAARLLKAVSEPHNIDDHELHVTTSIGVSVYPDDGVDAETLIKNADTAMYQAKENGRESCKFFTADMNIRAVARQSIEESLRRALERSEFVVHYQPRIDLRTGVITGAEALLRWNHPVRGPVPPTQFIPVAEDCGLILPIGKWVLREACEQAHAWVNAGLRTITMAVNISAIEFRNQNFLEGVFTTLRDTGLDPRSLELELTESVLMKHAASTKSIFDALRASGVQISVDDFGTGYSSLSYLKKFPIDALKIDQSFVSQITTANDETAIVTAVISMGRSLRLRVIAEGVETQQELAFLQAHHCDEAQGYHFSRPLPALDFTRLLERGIAHTVVQPMGDSLLMRRTDWGDRENLIN
jgi:diguanylate cyclase (GGDEF)-like protein/PAS domain S-box-containing protein